MFSIYFTSMVKKNKSIICRLLNVIRLKIFDCLRRDTPLMYKSTFEKTISITIGLGEIYYDSHKNLICGST